MSRPALPRPTDGELAILRVLWRRGASTVRQVHDELSGTQTTGYTTVLKLMQIMTDKGLVRRDERQRTHVYASACDQEHTQRQFVRDLLDRVFDGSAEKLVMQALATQKASPAELDQIKRMLSKMEGGGR